MHAVAVLQLINFTFFYAIYSSVFCDSYRVLQAVVTHKLLHIILDQNLRNARNLCCSIFYGIDAMTC